MATIELQAPKSPCGEAVDCETEQVNISALGFSRHSWHPEWELSDVKCNGDYSLTAFSQFVGLMEPGTSELLQEKLWAAGKRALPLLALRFSRNVPYLTT